MTDIQQIRREKLAKLVDEYGLAVVAKRIGKPASQVNDMLAGRKSFGEKVARAIEVSWGADMPAGWLDSDVYGERWEDTATDTPTEDEFALVPQLDIELACGDGKFVDHVVVKGGLAFKRSSLKDFGVTEKTARIVYAVGGSMAPTIQDGCVVLINTADTEPKEGRVFAICMPEGGILLKRLVRDYHPNFGGMVWIMRSDNPDKIAHPDKVLPPDDRTMIVGRAIWNDNRL